MIIKIEAPGIENILAEDECLVPAVEDLLLDALIEYRDTQRGTSEHLAIYESSAQITTCGDLNVKITINLVHPPQFTVSVN